MRPRYDLDCCAATDLNGHGGTQTVAGTDAIVALLTEDQRRVLAASPTVWAPSPGSPAFLEVSSFRYVRACNAIPLALVGEVTGSGKVTLGQWINLRLPRALMLQ